MKSRIFNFLIVCLFLIGIGNVAHADTKTFNHPFGQNKGDKWYTGNSSTSSVTNGVLNCTMGGPTSGKYRGDLWYNYTGSATVSTNYNFTLYPDRDVYLAVKFIGARPDGSLKLEMYTAASTWMNTQWNGGSSDGSVTASNGDVIYYFRLTKDVAYTGTSVDIQRLHVVIADAVVSTSYAVDWIATFQTIDDITAYKDASDDVIELAANGDLIATTSGTYATTVNWSISDGTGGYSAAAAAPTATENVWIPEGITITTGAASLCKNLVVEGTLTTGDFQADVKGNLTIKSAGVFNTVNSNGGTVKNLIIGANFASGPCTIQVDGQFGSINGTTGAGSGFRINIDAGGTTTFQGYGKMNVSILRPNGNARNQTFVFDMDANFLNTANSLQTLTLTNSNATSATKALIINAGKTVSFSTNNANSVLGGQTNTTTNQNWTGGNITYEINGTLNTGTAGGLWLTTTTNTGETTGLSQNITLRVGSTGKLIVGPKVLTGVAQPATQSITFDFQPGSQVEFAGSTATTFSGSTTSGAVQSYMNSLSNLKINNSGGLTLPVSATVNNTLDLFSGELATGINTLTLKGVVSGSGTINTGTSGTLAFGGASEQTLAATNLTSGSVNNLTVNAGSKLTTSGDFTATAINLKSNSASGTGTLINGGTITNTNASVQQYLPDARNWYVSSPVTGAVAPAGYTYYQRDEVNSSWFTSHLFAADSLFVRGRGYIAAPSTASATLQFNGTLNSGNVPVYITNSATGFNLIGNPYPCHINWTNSFITTNAAKIEPTIWLRTNAGTTNNSGQWSFVTYSAESAETVPAVANGGIIAPMQAFWVKAKATGVLTLDYSLIKSHQSSNPLRVPAALNTDRKRLRLELSNGTSTDETLIFFDDNAADSYDKYDSPKMFVNTAGNPEIFTAAGTEQLVINGMESYNYATAIPLGIKSGAPTNCTIAASQIQNFDADTRIILKDELTGAETDLTAGSSYNFTADATTSTSRFSVLFKSASGTTAIGETTKSDVFINAKAGKLTITCNQTLQANAKVAVYNSLGQLIYQQNLTDNHQSLNKNFGSGTYLVKIQNGEKQNTEKVIL